MSWIAKIWLQVSRIWSATNLIATDRHKDSEPLVKLGQGDYTHYIYGETRDD